MIHAALRRQSNKPQGGHMWPNRPPLLLCQQVFMHVADPKARWPQCLAVRGLVVVPLNPSQQSRRGCDLRGTNFPGLPDGQRI